MGAVVQVGLEIFGRPKDLCVYYRHPGDDRAGSIYRIACTGMDHRVAWMDEPVCNLCGRPIYFSDYADGPLVLNADFKQ